MASPIREHDWVLLYAPPDERHLVQVVSETKRVAGLGVLHLKALIGKPWGDRHRVGTKEYLLLRPLVTDHLALLERRAQIILPKDAARILFETSLGAGSRVVEAGVGSGALTLSLAHAVGPTGKVYAYDNREDHLEVGRRNLERAGLVDRVEFHLGDVTKDVRETDVDAFILDLPNPEAGIEQAWTSLRSSGVFAAYSPLVTQVEATVRALRVQGFLEVRSLELLERGWTIHDRGSRPDTNMLAHTGFLTFARRP